MRPPYPGTSSFPELNVRTYVKRDGKPGVWFFSLDAANALAVAVARAVVSSALFSGRHDVRRARRAGSNIEVRVRIAGAPAGKVERGRYRGLGDTVSRRDRERLGAILDRAILPL